MKPSNPFNSLNPLVQKWVYKQQWTDLRDIQKKSIPIILDRKHDVVISATTAAGKTEAAFLPACSAISEQTDGLGILYISPLKALINDQYRRLEGLGEMLQMPIVPWHGDSSPTLKRKCKSTPKGVLLITPESLESLMIRESGWIKFALGSLKYIVVDEYHSFLGTERGVQLQSLMHRLECLLEKENTPIPRIALSATLGALSLVGNYLRPNQTFPCTLIESTSSKSNLKMQIRGYRDSPLSVSKNFPSADQQIADDLYKILRGDSHLVFANSRKRTEQFSAMLSDLCEKNVVPNEFFPHHGSLSKESRTELERRLQKEHLPTTAVCTMTLELGIDIGKVASIAQVTAPHSVASLRQRLGRSGRRDNPSILRMFISERSLDEKSHLSDSLRMQLLQSIAMVRLLISDKWYEPANTEQLHLSTLLHQILSIITQWGGVRVEQLWQILCETGPFNNISMDLYKMLLQQMGSKKLISQLADGQLVLGENGEKIADYYTFYAVFHTPEEYKLEHNGRILGSLPVDSLDSEHVIFSGRRWEIVSIEPRKKIIQVRKATGGAPPLFAGGIMEVHDVVRKEMHKIYCSGEHRVIIGDTPVEYLDPTAQELFKEGHSYFMEAGLNKTCFFQDDDILYIIPWIGDKIINTLSTILISKGVELTNFSGIIEIRESDENEIISIFYKLLREQRPLSVNLARSALDKEIEKFDNLLSEELLCENYAAKKFDVDGTYDWIGKVLQGKQRGQSL